MSERRVGRLERRGLRRLRGLARGGCGGGSEPAAAPVTTAYAPTWRAVAPAALAATGAPVGEEPDRVEVKGTQESGSGGRESFSGGGQEPALAPPADKPGAPPPGAVVRRGRDGGGADLTLPLLAVAALIALALGARAARRSLGT